MKIPSFILEDFSRKITALFFACLIWYFVNEHISEVETFKNVKVDVQTFSATQVIVSNIKPEITVSIRGPRKILNKLESKDIQVTVNITELRSLGMNEVRISEDNIKLPTGLIVENLVTKTVNIDIDEIVEKEVDVRLRYNNRLSQGYSLAKEPEPKPEKVLIKGPSRRLEKISYLDTNPIYIDPNRTADFRVTAKVITPEGVSMNYDNVTAYVELKQKLSFKTLPVQDVFRLYADASKETKVLTPVGKAFAYVNGPPEILDNLTNKDFILFVKMDDINENGEHEVHFWCREPNVKLVNVTPSKVKIEAR